MECSNYNHLNSYQFENYPCVCVFHCPAQPNKRCVSSTPCPTQIITESALSYLRYTLLFYPGMLSVCMCMCVHPLHNINGESYWYCTQYHITRISAAVQCGNIDALTHVWVCVGLTSVPYPFLLRNKTHTHTHTHTHMMQLLATWASATGSHSLLSHHPSGHKGLAQALFCGSSPQFAHPLTLPHTPHLHRIPSLHIFVYFKHCMSHFIWHVSHLYWLASVLSADVRLAPPAGLSLCLKCYL